MDNYKANIFHAHLVLNLVEDFILKVLLLHPFLLAVQQAVDTLPTLARPRRISRLRDEILLN